MNKMLKKIKKSRKIQKMLSPEEMTLVSNIESILTELRQMGSGEGPIEEPAAVMEEEMPMTEEESMEQETEEKEVKMILKGLETTPSDSATASDDAEERMEEPLTEATEENVNEVEKALRVILGAVSANNVNKSVVKEQSPLIQCLNKIVEVQKANQNQVKDLSEAFGHVLNGLGIAKQMESVQKEVGAPKQINKSQNDELINAIARLIPSQEVKKEEQPYSQNNVVRKNLSDRETLIGLIGNRR